MNIFTVLMPWFDQIYAKCLLKKTKQKTKRSKVMSAVKKWSVPLEVSESYSSVTQLWNVDVNMDMELNINVRSIQYAVCAFVESSGLCHWQTNDPFPVKLSFLSAGGTDLIWLYSWENTTMRITMYWCILYSGWRKVFQKSKRNMCENSA